MEGQEKSDQVQVIKWLPSLKKPEFVGQPPNLWTDSGKIKGGIQCPLCGQNSMNIREAILHLKTKHSDQKPYACPNCDQRFNIKENLEVHKGVHVVEYTDGMFKCTLCRVGFRRHIVFRRHLLTHHMKEDSFVCTQCFNKFPTVAALEIHKLVHLARFEKRKSRIRRAKKIPEKPEAAVEVAEEKPGSPAPVPIAEVPVPVPQPLVKVKPVPPIPAPKKADIRPLSEALSAVAGFTNAPAVPHVVQRCPKVRKSNHGKVRVNGPLLAPVHENRVFQFYDPPLENQQFYNSNFSFEPPPAVVPNAPPKFICNYCGRCFKKESYLRYHLNSHAGFRPHMCNICGKSFTRVSILNKHRITVHHKNLYRGYNCAKCGKHFIRKDMFKRHQVTHSTYRPWGCPYCFYRSKTKQTCAKHIKTHQMQPNQFFDDQQTQPLSESCHGVSMDNFVPFSNFATQSEQTNNIIGPMTELLQQTCDFDDSPVLAQNLNVENPIDSLALVLNEAATETGVADDQAVTSILPDIFKDTETETTTPILEADIVIIPEIPIKKPKTPKKPKKPRKPANVPKPIETREEDILVGNGNEARVKLVSEMNEFEKSKLLKLTQNEIDEIASVKEITGSDIRKCKISMSEKYLIDCAKEKVTGQQSKISNSDVSFKTLGRYYCKQCNKSYNRQHDLTRHMLTHTGEKPHECSKCKMRFNLKSTLTKHLRTHSEDNIESYKCHICEKYMKSSNSLKRHIRIHTDARPFRCDLCQKGFSRRDKLTRHEKSCPGRETGNEQNGQQVVVKITPLGQEIMDFYTPKNS